MSISLVNDVGSIIIIGDEPRRSFPQPAQILAQAQTERLKALQKSEEVFTRKADGTEPLAIASGLITQFWWTGSIDRFVHNCPDLASDLF